jgi:RNA polymerase sigma-B factor
MPRKARRRTWDKAEIRRLFEQYHQERSAEVREQLILAHESLALYLARKFANRGEPLEDILQVARIGLLKAVDRYDVTRGIEFTTYATPTIVGEIKRHFRDKLWAIKVPRRLRELNYALMKSVEEMTQRLGRSPTIPEISDQTGVPFEDVIEAFEVGRAYGPASLDADIEGTDERASALIDYLGEEDANLEHVEDRHTLEAAMGQLPPRERMVTHLRFYEGLSQVEIAHRLGVSQMHVSRIQREALRRLRALMSDTGARRD